MRQMTMGATALAGAVLAQDFHAQNICALFSVAHHHHFTQAAPLLPEASEMAVDQKTTNGYSNGINGTSDSPSAWSTPGSAAFDFRSMPSSSFSTPFSTSARNSD